MISTAAAKEKGIISDVAGDVDIVLVSDLVSGNILVKNLEYLAAATLAGVVVGLMVPVILTSRADPVVARIASIGLAALLHRSNVLKSPARCAEVQLRAHAAPQQEARRARNVSAAPSTVRRSVQPAARSIATSACRFSMSRKIDATARTRLSRL